MVTRKADVAVEADVVARDLLGGKQDQGEAGARLDEHPGK